MLRKFVLATAVCVKFQKKRRQHLTEDDNDIITNIRFFLLQTERRHKKIKRRQPQWIR